MLPDDANTLDLSIMAFNNNSLSARLDELRSRNPPRLHSENTTGQSTPSFRYSGSFMSPPQTQTPTETPNLQRRFTTDLIKMQQIGPVGQQSNSGGVSVDISATVRASKGVRLLIFSINMSTQCAHLTGFQPEFWVTRMLTFSGSRCLKRLNW